MAGTTPAQLGGSTPCDQFDVRLLMGHLIGTARRGLGTAERGSTRDFPHVVTDVRDEDLAVNYAAFVDQIRLAWSRLDADDQVIAPWGPCTALEAVRGFTVETITHGWDLAFATGQPCNVFESAAERCLAFAAEVISARLRGVMYDQPVETVTASCATERLAHLLGHRR